MESKDRNCCQRYIYPLLLIFIIAISFSVFAVLYKGAQIAPPVDPPNEPEPSSFGDLTLGGSILADARLLSPSGVQSEQGIRALGDMPLIVLNETFDVDTHPSFWTSQLGITWDGSQGYFMSDGSVKFTPVSAQNYMANMSNSDGLSFGSNNSLQTYFWVNITSALSDGDGDYFILNLTLTSGDSIVYVLDGYYGTASNIKDVSSQITAYNSWVGVRITDIDQDIIVTYGDLFDIAQITFELHDADDGITANLDELQFKRLPYTNASSYWSDEDGNQVVSYFVDVSYNVTISDIVNASNVWLEFILYYNITDEFGNTLQGMTLAQDSLLEVLSFNTIEEWTSKVFSLPATNAMGDILTYNFTIVADAYGQVENTTDWVYATADLEGFDFFTVYWVEVDGAINVDLYVLIGSFGSIGAIGALGISRSRRSNNKIKMYNK